MAEHRCWTGARADARPERAARATGLAERAPARAGRWRRTRSEIPGARWSDRIEDCDLAAGFVWPKPAAHSWRGSPSTRSRANMCSTSVPHPAATRPSSRRPPRRWSPSRGARVVLASWSRTASASAPGKCGSSTPTRSPFRTTWSSSTACSLTHPAGPRRARGATRSAVSRASRFRLQRDLLQSGGRTCPTGRGGRLLGLHHRCRRERVRRGRPRPRGRSARRRVAAVRAPDQAGVPAHLPHRDHTSGFFVAPLRSSRA